MTSEHLRWAWTIVGALGVVAGVIATSWLVWLERQAARDLWAISQVVKQGMPSRMSAEGDQRDLRVLIVAAVFWTLAVTAQFAAGVAAILAFGASAISLLVASELLAVLGLIFLVVLGVLKHRSRDAVRNAIRLNRKPGT